MSTTRHPVKLSARLAATAALLAIGVAACSVDPDDASKNNVDSVVATVPKTTEPMPTLPMADVIGVALENGVFTQLATLVLDAKLVDTLRGDGPFTVFAPTDTAFGKLPKELFDALYADAATGGKLLPTVLTYHVVPGKLNLADLKDGELATVQGEPLTVSHDGDKVLINGHEVTGDVPATNGIVHILGDVLVPPSLVSAVTDIISKAAPADTTAGTTAGGTTPGTTA